MIFSRYPQKGPPRAFCGFRAFRGDERGIRRAVSFLGVGVTELRGTQPSFPFPLICLCIFASFLRPCELSRGEEKRTTEAHSTPSFNDYDNDSLHDHDKSKWQRRWDPFPARRAVPLIPMKNDATEAALGLLNLADAANHYSTIPSKRAAPQDDEQQHVAGSDSINCICGYSFDDGFSIACDDCSRWCHAACFEIVQGGVPEEWRCWVCAPRPVDRERAVRLQTQRKQDAIRAENEKRRRQTSPGVERKPRRQGALAIDGSNSRRKRRASVNVQPIGEDEHV